MARSDWRRRIEEETEELVRGHPVEIRITLYPRLTSKASNGIEEMPSWKERGDYAVRVMESEGYRLTKTVNWLFARVLHFVSVGR